MGVHMQLRELVADGQIVGVDMSLPVALRGGLKSLLAATTIAANGTVNNAAVTSLDTFSILTALLTVSAQSMDAGTTVDVYLQYSPDGGVTWDDLYHFTQITTAAYATPRVLFLNVGGAASQVSRTATDGAMDAATLREVSWCDRIRVKTVGAGFAGADTVTIKVDAYLQ